MKFYTKQHKFYCGVDLHAKTMYQAAIGVWCRIDILTPQEKLRQNLKEP